MQGYAHVQSSRVMANPIDDVDDKDRALHTVFDRYVGGTCMVMPSSIMSAIMAQCGMCIMIECLTFSPTCHMPCCS